MHYRLTSLTLVVALLAAACGGAASTTTSAPSGDSTTTSEEPSAVAGVLLSYNLNAGDTFVYDVVINQNIEMSSQGDGGSFSGEDLPGSASVEMTATGTFSFIIGEGPEPGTYEVAITSDLTDVAATGTVDGESIDSDEAPEFAAIEPVSVTVVVDEQGNVIPGSSGEVDPFADLFGGMGGFGPGAVPGAGLGQFFGPAFPDDEVAVGDSWSDSFETPGPGIEPIATSITSTVTGTDARAGAEVLVVESDMVVGPFEFDLGEFFVGLFSGFLPDDATPEEQAEIDALIENLRFVMSFDRSESKSTTYFDPVAGISRQFDVVSSSKIAMDINFPDEATGELIGFIMNMDIEQTVSHELVQGPSA